MKQKLFLFAAMAAGFVGGVLSQYVSPMMVNAQNSPIRLSAQSFNLVDKKGAAIGGVSVDGSGKVTLTVRDGKTGNSFYVDPVEALKNHPSFVPR